MNLYINHLSITYSPLSPVQFESECTSLRASLKDLEASRLSAEHQCRMVSQQLEQAKVVVAEMEQVQEHCGDLEREVVEVRGQLNKKDTQICQLELVGETICVYSIQVVF